MSAQEVVLVHHPKELIPPAPPIPPIRFNLVNNVRRAEKNHEKWHRRREAKPGVAAAYDKRMNDAYEVLEKEKRLDETWKEAVDYSGSTVSGAERAELYAALGPPSPPPNPPQSPPFPGWSVEKEKELRNAEFRENKKEKIFLNNMRLATKKENAKKAKREALDRSFHTKWDKRTVTVEDLF